ncbi:CDP-glycerol glycerophosphotransferase (TagB/SpsB family) [Brevibacterium sanguinis]|uniref:CDP-glycerol glycerophosphotransferase (TagB/SpsB family) n=2 Tax=Brevibacterium TaxID=1696 RepID=A0A366ILA9_9MICO|nr:MULTISPECIES: CDP-glycerol glycerophosphotransferase family protein [Brevibacterium]RBP65418.1 CDP-glycerol glycerophosphotransferase (TagB/SpsB family) [Brevibacterium sanguinis]RBP72052.1 CDP-glycerol glycerophosphotransferase (TagB/SpsB family) [Brevibacterium celere]
MSTVLKNLKVKRPRFRPLVRSVGLAALESKPWKATSRWLRGTAAIERLELEYDGSGLDTPVIVYFGDGPAKLYQVLQWLPIFEELDNTHPVAIVLRSPRALQELRSITHLPLVLKRRFDPLQDFYHELDPKVALYVNNGVRNFQSLGYAPMVHVHINHGESDKVSMVSNQVKAYDRVLVAGPAAIERHKKALIEFDFNKLVEIGRPQLDIDLHSTLPQTDRRTAMYAPTWEGENDANNYTSVDCFGVAIVEALLSIPDIRVVYKPHPRVETSQELEMVQADARIRQLIEDADESSSEHVISMQGDILQMFADVDLLITDISSVGLDFLYLRPQAPIILTDRRNDLVRLNEDSPISRATPVITQSNRDDIRETVTRLLEADPHMEDRRRLRSFYFGERAVGESTRTFIATIESLIESRRQEIAGKPL